MRLALHSVVLILVSGRQVRAQSAAVAWFPIATGDRWIYEHETRDENGAGRAHLEVHRWKTEEITIGSLSIPEGMLVTRQVRVLEGDPPTGGWVKPTRAYLIRGDCLYADAGWEPANHQLTADFRKGLGTYISPDFCFPLAAHKTWGAPHGLPDWGVNRPEAAKDWKVAGIQVRGPSAPGRQNTFHILSISAYPGAGITVDSWFEKGVGVVREDEIHHGTVGERHVRLERFEPAPRQ